MNLQDYSKVVNARNRAVIFIGDQHLPYEHQDYLSFIKSVKKSYAKQNPLIINMGDEVDYHAMSFHDSDEDLFSAGHELDLAVERLEAWNKAFPEMLLLESNHGSMAFRRFKSGGIPIRLIKPLQEIYNTPKWTWWHDIMIKTKNGPVYLCHGKASGYGALAKEQGCSSVQGHYHGKHEITWHNRIGHKRFNMFTGCGINWQSMAFAYGKNHLPKPILGCGSIDNNGMPHLHHMALDGRGRWVGRS